MIQCESLLKIADNSGAQEVVCIKVLGGAKSATIGSIIVVSIKKSIPKSKVKNGAVHKAVIVRTKKKKRRIDGSYINFNDNAVVLVGDKQEMLGSRVFGMIAGVELKSGGFSRILSLAEEVL